MNKNVLIVGTGPMAIAYAEILKTLKIDFQVIGRGEASASKFETETNIKPICGGLKKYVDNNLLLANTYVIIVTGTEELMPSLKILLETGAEKILVEKPAAISIEELLQNETYLSSFSNKIYVAYNRRFYASVFETQKLINEDGGLISMNFEFTEWAHKIEPLTKAPGVKENWFFANSTHVVDLAFFMGGKPNDWCAYSKEGELKWHTKASFVGAGITNKNVLFSYSSNWESAGRWAVELLTKNKRIYLKPLEGVVIQNKGSITLTEHAFDNSLDIKYKPGLFKQIEAFIFEDVENRLCSINEQMENCKSIYKKILN